MKPLFLILALICLLSCHKTPGSPAPGGDHQPPDSTPGGVHPPPADTTLEYGVAPKQTDPLITLALDSHFVSVKIHAPLKNVLFVFLPGSYAKPAQYRGIVRKAASLGFHAVGLMYPDDKPVNNFCASSNDTTCHRRARMEIVDGIDRSPNISVDPPNSIVNRLRKLLVFLSQTRPAEQWSQFLDGDSVRWNMVMIGGHSQGGGNAAVMARFYPLKKVIMFSMMDWLNSGKVPDWENMHVRDEIYRDIFNPLDEAVPYAGARLGWKQMNMVTDEHPAVNSDDQSPPYDHAKVLLTGHQPAKDEGPKFHNSTVMDAYVQKDSSGRFVLDKQWEYLLTE